LQEFDDAWTKYERLYVYELMVIENDARRFIIESIKVDNLMIKHERSFQGKSLWRDPIYNKLREDLLRQLATINTVTNMTGKGRDDLVDINILLQAEQLMRELMPG
jgi:hypothetical protein